MSTMRDPDMVLAAWLDEGPTDLPDATRRAILTALPTTPQARRGLLAPRRLLPMNPFARLAIVAVVAVVALGTALSLGAFGPRQPIGGPTARPSATPEPTSTARPVVSPSTDPAEPSMTPSPLRGTALFTRTVRYTLPAGEGLVVSPGDWVRDSSPGGRISTNFYQFRHPNPAAVGFDRGVVLRSFTGVHDDPCAEQSTIRMAGGPASTIAYLRTVPTVRVTDLPPATVGGVDASQVLLEFDPPTDACPNVYLWDDDSSITDRGGRDPARLTIFDLGGTHIVILTFGPLSWYPTADAFIHSLVFTEFQQ